MAKVKLTVYLDPDVLEAFERKAAATGAPKSALAQAAVASFVTPDQDELEQAALIRRIDGLHRLGERLERNLDISIEMQALYLRWWLTATPPLAEAAKPAAHAKGKERFEAFVESLAKRMAQSGRFAREVSLDLRAPAPLGEADA
jgi:hypothetical protein